jgi:transcriptional regulator with XRE-family HTH domain
MYRENFKERFESIRKEQNLSTNKIARYLEIGVASVQKYCYGENTPTFDNLCKLADLFGVSIDYLVGRTDEPEINKKV